MNTKSLLTAATVLIVSASGAFPQGSLTPPAGPPVASMKTLDQVEARTPVTAETCPGSATAVHVISNAGSYYLTGNLTGQPGKTAIQINATAVTLDLNGFNLNAAVGSTKGISVTSVIGPVVIRNGIVRNWPQQGIHITNSIEFTIEDITVYAVSGRGIDALGGGTIERVSVRGARDYGIYCAGSPQTAVRDCKVESVTGSGITMGIYAPNALVSRCSVASVTGGAGGGSVAGISADDGVVESCSVRSIVRNGSSNRLAGIENASTVTDCTVHTITGNGPSGGASPQEAAGIFGCSNVTRCSVSAVNGGAGQNVVGIGLCTSVSHCQVSGLSGSLTKTGISGSHISDCSVFGGDGGRGIEGRNIARCTVQDCDWGLYLVHVTIPGGGESTTATGNTILDCHAFGILVGAKQAVISGNNVHGNLSAAGSVGIQATGVFSHRIEGNHVSRWATGINAPAASTLVVRNTAGSNTTDFTIAPGMPVAAITAIGTNPNANIYVP
jgi:hypothetical protein